MEVCFLFLQPSCPESHTYRNVLYGASEIEAARLGVIVPVTMQLHASVPEDRSVISPGRFGQKDISAELKKSLLNNGMKGNGKVKKEEEK